MTKTREMAAILKITTNNTKQYSHKLTMDLGVGIGPTTLTSYVKNPWVGDRVQHPPILRDWSHHWCKLILWQVPPLLLLGCGSLKLRVDWNAAFAVQLNADRFQAEAFGVRTTSNAHQQNVTVQLSITQHTQLVITGVLCSFTSQSNLSSLHRGISLSNMVTPGACLSSLYSMDTIR